MDQLPSTMCVHKWVYGTGAHVVIMYSHNFTEPLENYWVSTCFEIKILGRKRCAIESNSCF